MRFSFKKTLATVLSIAMILSAFVGVLTTSAAAANVVGTLTMDDVTASATAENKFDVVANINLDTATSYVHVAYKLGTLPEGVALDSVATNVGTATIDANSGAIMVDAGAAAVSAIAVTMTFIAPAEALGAFTIAIAAVDYADVNENNDTIDVTDTAVVTIVNHAASDVLCQGDSTHHWYPCIVEGCTEHKYGVDWHVWEDEVITPPTCTEPGVAIRSCKCGRGWGQVSIDPTGEHNYVYTNNGADHTKTCTVGGESVVEDHTYVDGTCACGAVEVTECTHENAKVYYDLEDGKWYKSCECGLKEETAANVDTVMGVSRSIILAEKIGIKFAVQASAQANALAKYDDYFIRIETQSYDGTYNLNDVVLDIASDDTYDATTSLISYSYMNLTSYEMTIPVNATIYYLKDGEIVACSKTYTDTLNDRAMTFAKKFDYSDLSSASAKEGAMYLNLIKYGIEAQKYFAKSNTNSNIATAELPTFEEGYEAYVTTTVPELTETKSNVKAEGVTAAMSRNVIVGASNALLYKIQVKDTTIPSTADLSKLYLEVSYVSSTSKVGTVTETVCLADLELVSGTYRYNFEKVAIYDSHRKVTAKLYSIDNPENILITNTYSVESDAIKNINNGTDTDFWKAMAIFGHSALDFFGYDTAVE